MFLLTLKASWGKVRWKSGLVFCTSSRLVLKTFGSCRLSSFWPNFHPRVNQTTGGKRIFWPDFPSTLKQAQKDRLDYSSLFHIVLKRNKQWFSCCHCHCVQLVITDSQSLTKSRWRLCTSRAWPFIGKYKVFVNPVLYGFLYSCNNFLISKEVKWAPLSGRGEGWKMHPILQQNDMVLLMPAFLMTISSYLKFHSLPS